MAPLFMKSISIKIDGQEYACQVRSAIIEATPGDTVTYEALSPGCSYSNVGATTYALHLIGVQDWDTSAGTPGPGAKGLAAALAAKDGQTVAFTYQAHGDGAGPHPASPTEPSFSGSAIAVAPSYGGESGAWAEFDVTLPINGKPTKVVALTAEDEAAAAAEAAPEAVAA